MREIEAAELKRRLEADEALTVVDIREQGDYAAWHIDGSRNLPVYDALKSGDDASLLRAATALPRDRPVVTVCRGGVVSRRAAELLETLGFSAASLSEGMYGWGAVSSEAEIGLRSHPQATFTQIRRNGKGCLSYLLGADRAAVVFDPSVEIEAYVEGARRRGLEIRHVFETHVHADHLSRARELARATGARLVMPENRRAVFPFTPTGDGEKNTVGGIEIETIATPGHTGESVCYLVSGEALLTGDTLFIDAVGRPDLERGDAGATDGARALYRSLHERLKPLAGEIVIYPAHHAEPIGFDRRPIGASLSQVRSTLPLLRLAEQEFVTTIVGGLGSKPANFQTIVGINEGRSALDELDPLELEAGPNSCAVGR